MKNKFILLIIIYVAFISLGLPDGIIGIAWPTMRIDFNLAVESLTIFSTSIWVVSAFSSFLSGYALSRFGVGKVTFISGLLTAISLIGISFASSPYELFIWLIPLGLGGGAVDAGLNHYVSENYEASHMNFLHCFWGVGAFIGPIVMSSCIKNFDSWHLGYRSLGAVQLCLSAIILISVVKKLWSNKNVENQFVKSNVSMLSKPTIISMLLFFVYVGFEFSIGIWFGTYLIEFKNIDVLVAGFLSSTYYFSIMCGRLFSGFFVNKIGNSKLIKYGLALSIFGCIIVLLSSNIVFLFFGIALVGCGFAPIYPGLMHETPKRFSKEIYDKLIGFQAGSACVGGFVVSTILGFIMAYISMGYLFIVMLILIVIELLLNNYLEKIIKTK